MSKIFKYELRLEQWTELDTFAGACILDVQMQRWETNRAQGQRMAADRPVLWALVDTERPMVKRRVFTAMTGADIPKEVELWADYVATLQIGRLVAHVFVMPEGA